MQRLVLLAYRVYILGHGVHYCWLLSLGMDQCSRWAWSFRTEWHELVSTLIFVAWIASLWPNELLHEITEHKNAHILRATCACCHLYFFAEGHVKRCMMRIGHIISSCVNVFVTLLGHVANIWLRCK